MSGEGDVVRDVELRRYHLGTLPPERQEAIDDRFLADEALHAELQAAADDLIHAYLDGQLSADERARFETHFLASRRHRDRLAFVRTLVTAVDRFGKQTVTGLGAEPAPTRSSPRVTLLPWAAALVVGLAAGAWAIGERRARERERALDHERVARLEQQLAGQARPLQELQELNRGSTGAIATWTLRPGLQRGVTADAFVVRSEWILLRVPLGDHLRALSYAISLQTSGGDEIQRSHRLPVTSGPSGRTLDLMVPARALPPATYVVSILSEPDRRELDAVPFLVRQ